MPLFKYYRVSKKNAMEIQQAVVHQKHGQTIQFLHRTKEQLFSFSMILFLNRNDEKWPHTRQIKIAGRNQFFHRWELLGKRRELKLNVILSKMSSTRQSSS
jgi:hypothetical protein